MSAWEAITWDVARAGGLTAYVLLTLSVAIGLSLSLRWQSPRWPRIINSELHNFATLLATIFTGVHVLAVAVDPYTHFGLSEVLIPLASHYRPLWMALGIVGLYLGIAIGISTWLRPKIGYDLWRRLHVLTLVLYGLVTVHGIATGSDTGSGWTTAIYLASLALVGTLLIIRILKLQETSAPANRQVPPAQPRMPAQPLQPGARTVRPMAVTSTVRSPRNATPGAPVSPYHYPLGSDGMRRPLAPGHSYPQSTPRQPLSVGAGGSAGPEAGAPR